MGGNEKWKMMEQGAGRYLKQGSSTTVVSSLPKLALTGAGECLLLFLGRETGI